MSRKKPILQTFADLFCGIGGFHMALARFCLRCVFACDLNIACRANYRLNFGIRPAGDIRVVSTIPRHDVMTAGIPCTPFSQSGAQGGTDDPAGLLYKDVLRLVELSNPKVLIAENVRQFKTLHGGPAFNEMKAVLHGKGYSFHDALLNAKHYGVPQNRTRLYIVAIKKHLLVEGFSFPPPVEEDSSVATLLEDSGKTMRQAIGIEDWNRRSDEDIPWQLIGRGLIRIGDIRDNTQGDRIYSIKGHTPTITASSGGWGAGTGLFLVGDRVRRLTAREAARCMAIPDSYRFLSSQRRSASQVGNGVVVSVVEAIMREVFKAIGQSLDFGKVLPVKRKHPSELGEGQID